MLGLAHLAVPYYSKCLEIRRDVQRLDLALVVGEDFTREAALALQMIWMASGDVDEAKKVTEEWLVL